MKRLPEFGRGESHDRWLISYADFITLLFSFFVLMFASSQTDKAKARMVSESVVRALERGASHGRPPAVAKILGGTVDQLGNGNAMMRGPGGTQRNHRTDSDDVSAELLPSVAMLSNSLKVEIEQGKVEIRLEARGLVVSFKQTALFQSGDDRIDSEAIPTLEKLATAIKVLPNEVRVEGHTDSVPIHNSRFRSNWELSAARSIAVMDLFINRFGIPKSRVAIVGYAENAAVDTNESPEGRAKNRRVDVVIQNKPVAVRSSGSTLDGAGQDDVRTQKNLSKSAQAIP
jgi:chemotaxis protein MotB